MVSVVLLVNSVHIFVVQQQLRKFFIYDVEVETLSFTIIWLIQLKHQI